MALIEADSPEGAIVEAKKVEEATDLRFWRLVPSLDGDGQVCE